MPARKAWKRNEPELVDRLLELMRNVPCTRRTMFGCPAFFVNGNMFAGLHADRLFLRLSESDRERLAAENDEAEPFAPLPGHVMREYMTLPGDILDDEPEALLWIGRARRFASALPPK